jgi:hypothetical protein
MTRANNSGRVDHPILWTLCVLSLAAAAFAGYLASWAGSDRVCKGQARRLANYRVRSDRRSRRTQIGQSRRARRISDARGGLHGLPHGRGRRSVRRRPRVRAAVRDALFDQYHARFDTGIGSYTNADFLDALHKGIGRGNTKLYPAMPYASYTYHVGRGRARDQGVSVLAQAGECAGACEHAGVSVQPAKSHGLWSAAVQSRQALRAECRSRRRLESRRISAEAMGHCGECHTPRNLAFALNNRQKFAGAVQAGWRAYNITPDRSSGVGAWSDADLMHYLHRSCERAGHRIGSDGRSGR